MPELTDLCAVIVRRVVEARKNAAAGLPQELPLTTTRSSPPSTSNRGEKEVIFPTADTSQKELPLPPKVKWYSRLKCW
jgi:hypothetical protein